MKPLKTFVQDIMVDSSQGVGAASLIFEETIDEGGQPEEELEEPSHPDQEFHNAVKAKVDALNMLATGSIEIGERIGALCVLCGTDHHSVGNRLPILLHCGRA